MNAKKPLDLMSLDDLESLARQPFAGPDAINLAEVNMPPMSISDNYSTVDVVIRDGSVSEMKKLVENLGENMGLDLRQLKLYAPLYEALLNAFQHGNKRDSAKPIKLHYAKMPEYVEMLVEDTGGILNPNFIPFVLRQRQHLHGQKNVNFYEFCGVEKPDTNFGTGTFFIHAGSDEVTYHKSGNNGLIIKMVKHLNGNPQNMRNMRYLRKESGEVAYEKPKN